MNKLSFQKRRQNALIKMDSNTLLVPFVPLLIALIKFSGSRIIKLYKEIKKLPKTSTKSSNQIDYYLLSSEAPFLPILHSI